LRLDQLAVEGGVEGSGPDQLDWPGRGVCRSLCLAHVLKTTAGGVGVDQARSERHQQATGPEVSLPPRLAKLQIVAAGLAITTIAPVAARAL
jgi:hypothetical protein